MSFRAAMRSRRDSSAESVAMSEESEISESDGLLAIDYRAEDGRACVCVVIVVVDEECTILRSGWLLDEGFVLDFF